MREQYEPLWTKRERLFLAGLAALAMLAIALVLHFAEQIDAVAR